MNIMQEFQAKIENLFYGRMFPAFDNFNAIEIRLFRCKYTTHEVIYSFN